jgi:hypothetical protein
MSQQHMMFPPSEQPPEEERTVPATQAVEKTDYAYGSDQTFEVNAAYGKLQSPSAPLPTWQIVLIAIALVTIIGLLLSSLSAVIGLILALLALVAVGLLLARWGFSRAVSLPVQSFTVGERPTLVIRNPAGSISIRQGSEGCIQVVATKYLSGLFGGQDSIQVDCRQQENTLNVAVEGIYRQLFSSVNLGHVELDITVPPACHLQVEAKAGSLQVMGVTGRLALRTNAGSITVLHSTLEDGSSLITDAGTINVQQSHLCGNVRFHSNAGALSFAGALERVGSYQLTTNFGSIDVALPADASFMLAASSNLGAVTNEFGYSVVGGPPHAALRLHTSLGTVTVRRGVPAWTG